MTYNLLILIRDDFRMDGMRTEILEPDREGIERAAALMRAGELVAFPTETVWGIGAHVFDDKAVRKIFAVKGRPADNPLIIHISDLDQVERVAEEIPESFYRLAAQFFPGPLALILRKGKEVPESVTGGQMTVAVRMPLHPIARDLIARVGPIAAPSANLSGRPSSTEMAHVLQDFQGKIAAVLKGGSSEIGIESTVLSLAHGEPLLLRPGAISHEALETALGSRVQLAEAESRPLSPGMKYRHYAPSARVRLFETEEALDRSLRESGLCKRVIKPSARSLYASFRQADLEGVEEILILADARLKSDRALYNRVLKASSS